MAIQVESASPSVYNSAVGAANTFTVTVMGVPAIYHFPILLVSPVPAIYHFPILLVSPFAPALTVQLYRPVPKAGSQKVLGLAYAATSGSGTQISLQANQDALAAHDPLMPPTMIP
jgi:hypothetical protein